MKAGRVYLVGAGPGDPSLLTLKAKSALEMADVVVYDRLVGAEILAMMPPLAEQINVGKTAGSHPVPQNEINQILLDKALEGKTVVRLKGGDSFVFGRGGEELELLAQRGIPFTVVPGITAATAATAYAGIPVTHRDFCSSLHLITGHARAGGQLSIDFSALVALDGTLVFYMSLSTLGDIARGLLQAGMAADMPAAVIENGTRVNQRKVLAPLGELEKAVAASGVVSPALIVVGRVCSLSPTFDWFETLPLKGKRYVLTRPVDKIGRLSAALTQLGAETLEYPCIETRPLSFSPPTSGYDWLVFTSPAGVEAYFTALAAEKKDSRALGGLLFAVVGRETAAALKKQGIVADFIPTVFDGNHLATELLQAGHIKKGQRVALVRGNLAGRDLPSILQTSGILVTEFCAYETSYLPQKDLQLEDFDRACFTSASTVEAFAAAFSHLDLTKVQALCIGAQTQKAALGLGMKTLCAKEASIDSMIDALLMEDGK